MSQLKGILRPSLGNIQPYNAGLNMLEVQSRYKVSEIAKLASNENPAGPAPQVLGALKFCASDLFLYPDGSARQLRKVLADYLQAPAENLIFGNGSEELISIICRSVVETGDRIITLYPSFPLHEDYAQLMGANIERVAIAGDLMTDVCALVEAVSKPAKMLIFANPMNPVGCWLNPAQLQRVIAAKHPDTLLVLDEAYCEYARSGDYVSGDRVLQPSDGNWILLRTFSKAWGLAGLRLGFGLCSSAELREALDLSRTPFNINVVAQLAAATALQNEDYMLQNVAKTVQYREDVVMELKSRGYKVAPSLGNFVFIDVKTSAIDFADRLLKRGTIVKPWKQPGFETFIRVSIGAPHENAKFLSDLAALA
jgi:histidinol-phosphate aminotransferase